MDKVIVGKDIKFGENITLSPDFEPSIKVVFAGDMTASQRDLLLDITKRAESDSEDQEKLNREFTSKLLEIMIVDWNLHDEKDQKVEISIKTIESLLSSKLSSWIGEKARELFFDTSKSSAPKEDA